MIAIPNIDGGAVTPSPEPALSKQAVRRWLAVAALALVFAGACGNGDGTAGDTGPTVVVTTAILGDVVRNVVGEAASVEVVMPAGASPHDFQASARQVSQMRSADALVVNGAGLEAGLTDVIERTREAGVPTFEAAPAGSAGPEHDAADGSAPAEDEHADEPHADEPAAGDDEHGHEHDAGEADPHFFTSPAAMIEAVESLVAFLRAGLPGIEGEELRRTSSSYLARLQSLDEDVEVMLSEIPAERRVIVTNHDVFGAFAQRYQFEVIGTVVPTSSTADAASAAALAKLAKLMQEQSVTAIFLDASSSDDLAKTLAEEVDGVEVVELFTESLGGAGSDAATYVDMMQTNARRIAEALS